MSYFQFGLIFIKSFNLVLFGFRHQICFDLILFESSGQEQSVDEDTHQDDDGSDTSGPVVLSGHGHLQGLLFILVLAVDLHGRVEQDVGDVGEEQRGPGGQGQCDTDEHAHLRTDVVMLSTILEAIVFEVKFLGVFMTKC